MFHSADFLTCKTTSYLAGSLERWNGDLFSGNALYRSVVGLRERYGPGGHHRGRLGHHPSCEHAGRKIWVHSSWSRTGNNPQWWAVLMQTYLRSQEWLTSEDWDLCCSQFLWWWTWLEQLMMLVSSWESGDQTEQKWDGCKQPVEIFLS